MSTARLGLLLALGGLLWVGIGRAAGRTGRRTGVAPLMIAVEGPQTGSQTYISE